MTSATESSRDDALGWKNRSHLEKNLASRPEAVCGRSCFVGVVAPAFAESALLLRSPPAVAGRPRTIAPVSSPLP